MNCIPCHFSIKLFRAMQNALNHFHVLKSTKASTFFHVLTAKMWKTLKHLSNSNWTYATIMISLQFSSKERNYIQICYCYSMISKNTSGILGLNAEKDDIHRTRSQFRWNFCGFEPMLSHRIWCHISIKQAYLSVKFCDCIKHQAWSITRIEWQTWFTVFFKSKLLSLITAIENRPTCSQKIVVLILMLNWITSGPWRINELFLNISIFK